MCQHMKYHVQYWYTMYPVLEDEVFFTSDTSGTPQAWEAWIFLTTSCQSDSGNRSLNSRVTHYITRAPSTNDGVVEKGQALWLMFDWLILELIFPVTHRQMAHGVCLGAIDLAHLYNALLLALLN